MSGCQEEDGLTEVWSCFPSRIQIWFFQPSKLGATFPKMESFSAPRRRFNFDRLILACVLAASYLPLPRHYDLLNHHLVTGFSVVELHWIALVRQRSSCPDRSQESKVRDRLGV